MTLPLHLHISWEVVRKDDKKKCILERLAAQVHQMINHTDRAEINRMERRCSGLFESPGVSLPDAYHFCLMCHCFSFLCVSPRLPFHSLSFSHSLYLLYERKHLVAFLNLKAALEAALDNSYCEKSSTSLCRRGIQATFQELVTAYIQYLSKMLC